MGIHMYTELDSILDTRYEIIKLMNRKVAEFLLHTGFYHTRSSDTYGPITYDMFKPIWDRRNKNVLFKALDTPILAHVCSYYVDEYLQPQSLTITEDIKLYINTYPYILTEDEAKNIEKAIAIKLKIIRVELIHKSPSELTTAWCASNLRVMFKYDFLDWLNYQVCQGTYNLGMKKVHGVTPFLSNCIGGMYGVKDEDIEKIVNQFNVIANVVFVDVKHFSVIMVRPPKEEKKE